MAKLGSAYASILPTGCDVTVNRDLAIPSRMLKRALTSGLPSAGINVVDLSAVPIPVARYFTSQSGPAGGVHVRMSSDDPAVAHIIFFDRHGMDLDKGTQRKVESAFFREDVRRAHLDDIGTTSYASGVPERYSEAFMQAIDCPLIERGGYRLVVDYSRGPTSDVLPMILRSLGSDVIDLNAGRGFTRTPRSQAEYTTAFEQLATIVPALHFDLGAMLNVTGERFHIVDSTGRRLPEMQILAALASLVLQQEKGATIAVPVDAPAVFERLAEQYGGKVIRTRRDAQSIMAAATQKQVRLAGDGRGRTIFPEFHCTFDAMYSLVKLLELLIRTHTTLPEVVSTLPAWHISETDVSCPWDKKGRVMRMLGEQYRERGPRSPDGIKVQLGDDWVLILPDPDEPQFHLVAEAQTQREAQSLVDKYAGIVTALQQ
jgi:mannose-1-phosphate guanylyltransferase/phosphomannomutase